MQLAPNLKFLSGFRQAARVSVATAAVMASLVLAAPLAGANGSTTYFVETSGSGTSCTQALPCSSINTALQDALANGAHGVIEVGAGSFYEDVSVPTGHYTIAGIPGATLLFPETWGFHNDSGTVTISGFTVIEAGIGGAVNWGTMTLDGDVFTGNPIANYGSMSVTNSSVTGYSSFAGLFNSGTVTVDSSTFNNNFDGIENSSGVATITNSTLANNSNDGVHTNSGTTVLGSSTIAGSGNFALENSSGSVTTAGVVLDGSNNDTCNQYVNVDGSYNIDAFNHCGFQSFYGDLVSTDANTIALDDNGGPTMTEAILPTSAAHNLIPAVNCPAFDQRGETRPTGATAGFCDAGSYQWAAPTSMAITTLPLTGITAFAPNIGPVTVELYDAQGFPAISSHAVVLNLSSTSPDGFFAIANLGVPTSSVVIPIGQTSAGFYLGSVTPTQMSLNITAAHLGTVTQIEKIVHGPALYANVLTGDNQSAIVGQPLAVPMSVEITDAQGNEWANSPVIFTVTNGVGTFSGGLSTVTLYTDVNGEVVAPTFTIGHQPSSIEISVSDGAATTGFDETGLTGPPSAISFTDGNNQSVIPATAFGTAPQVTVVDLYGNPVDSATVDFAVSSGSATLDSPTESTDINGVTSDGLTSGTVAGPVTVTATVDGTSISADSTGLVVTPDVPAQIVVNGGNNQSTGAGTNFTNPISVLVSDQYGNVTPGISVDFVAPTGTTFTSGTPSSTETIVTDANGIATSHSVNAGHVAGPISISATVDGTAIAQLFDETIVPGPPANIAITSGNSQSVVSDHSYPIALSTTVTDQYGNVITGVHVIYNVVSGSANFYGPKTQNLVTANGVTTTTSFAAGDHAGTETVTATVQGTSVSATFSGIVITPPPSTSTVASFQLGLSALTPGLKTQIAGLATTISRFGNTKVMLTGYADGTGSRNENKALSLSRAQAIQGYLVSLLKTAHITGVSITSIGKGATNFIGGNPGSAANRRVVATII